MKQLSVEIESNPYFWSPPGPSILTGALKRFENNFSNVLFIHVLLSYPMLSFRGVDLLAYLGNDILKRLQTEPVILIFDATFEGLSPIERPIAEPLYQSCIKHNINPKKIFYFTGNFVDNSADINIVPIFILDNENDWKTHYVRTIEQSKQLCNENYQNIILSLSRRNRSHRLFAHLVLFNSTLRERSIISQDRIENHNFNMQELKVANLSIEDVEKFKQSLPLIADEDKFHINEPFNSLTLLHAKTIFSIVNETLADNVHNTTLFFSEKILKPIVNFQPMVIYGHQGINKKLSLLGFKTYEQYFNLDFDDEPNDLIRYMKLIDSIKQTVDTLLSYSRKDQIAWRYQYEEVLQYNFNVFLERKNTNEQLSKFELMLTDIC